MSAERRRLYLVGVPGEVGGAATKVAHLIRLLHSAFAITLVLPDPSQRKDKKLRRFLEPFAIEAVGVKDLQGPLEGVALGICVDRFFISGMAKRLKELGLKIVWSNEMMWEFKGEADAVKEGLVDRVLWVSEFQREAFKKIYDGTASAMTGNYIDPDDFFRPERKHSRFRIGRLSRPDPMKYPVDFPVFYEELGLADVQYRVMVWTPDVAKQYRWHTFGPEWDLLAPNKEATVKFLHSLDLFVYPLGHKIKESWGRAVVEAMLTGCIPIVPAGHQFHRLMEHGKSGVIFNTFGEAREWVRELYGNYPLRERMSIECARHARECLCNPEEHRAVWRRALTFEEGSLTPALSV